MAVSASQAKRIKQARKRVSSRKEQFLLKPIEPSKRQEVRYRKVLNEAIDSTRDAVLQLYNTANDPKDMNEAMDNLFDNMTWWDELNLQVGSVVDDLNGHHQQAFYETIQTSVGINVAGFVGEQGIEDLLKAVTESNSNAITDLKAAAQKRVSDLVMNALTGQEEKSPRLREQLLEALDGVTKRQAKVIARDQTQRAVNTLNQFRQERAGIDDYKWQTSQDNRVRDDHAKMNGLIVNWKSGIIKKTALSIKRGLAGKNVKDVANGHIGQDYQCRCSAIPILEV